MPDFAEFGSAKRFNVGIEEHSHFTFGYHSERKQIVEVLKDFPIEVGSGVKRQAAGGHSETGLAQPLVSNVLAANRTV